jgi:hypothetical protein
VSAGVLEVTTAQAAHLFRAIRKGLPLDTERRVAAMLEGTLAGLQRSNVINSRRIATSFHRVLETDPDAWRAFERIQKPCNCKLSEDGHAQMCPWRLNAYLNYISEGQL